MNIESQVTSLELSKQLKAAGYPQGESYFVWVLDEDGEDYYLIPRTGMSRWTSEWYAAPTVAELGEKLKATGQAWYSGPTESDWWCNLHDPVEIVPLACSVDADTESNARAKMWLWLKENGYLEVGDE